MNNRKVNIPSQIGFTVLKTGFVAIPVKRENDRDRREAIGIIAEKDTYNHPI